MNRKCRTFLPLAFPPARIRERIYYALRFSRTQSSLPTRSHCTTSHPSEQTYTQTHAHTVHRPNLTVPCHSVDINSTHAISCHPRSLAPYYANVGTLVRRHALIRCGLRVCEYVSMFSAPLHRASVRSSVRSSVHPSIRPILFSARPTANTT